MVYDSQEGFHSADQAKHEETMHNIADNNEMHDLQYYRLEFRLNLCKLV